MNIIYKISLLITLFSIIINAGEKCGTTSGNSAPYIPTSGTIRILVIFAQFKDDPNTDLLTNYPWQRNELPSWATTFVNSSAGGTYSWNNLSQYFNEMSNGNFQVIGDVYGSLVTTDNNQSSYSSIGQANREILLEVDQNTNYNFANYDNLNGSNFGTDGKVDLVYIIYRNVEGNTLMDYSGAAHLNLSGGSLSVDGKTIYDNTYISGGIQQRGGYNGRDYTMHIAAHELGHYLLGGGHIDGAGNLCLMSGVPAWNSSRGMHSWERQKLNWISYTDKTSDGSVTMTDYMTTDQVYRVPISSNEFFLFEYRNKISAHEQEIGDTGFYFYKVNNASTFPPELDVLCADGNWDFVFNTSNLTLTKTTPNSIFGKSELNKYQYWDSNGDGIEELYACYTPVYYENAMWGDTEDAFDLTFNNVLSPVSNPNSMNGGSLNFSVEVTGSNVLQFYFSSPYYGSPSKPQYLRISSNPGNGYNRITWDANTETDLVNYEVSRKVQEWGGTWEVVANTTNNYFIDTDYFYTNPYGDFHCTYRVRAKDSQNKYSVYSEEKTAGAEFAHKIAQQSESEKVNFVNTCDNYPNPFNPSTQISFTIKESGKMSLKVYDVLGKEVANLADGYYEAGKHTATFDGSNLASGIYFYRLTTPSATITKKMMLVK